MGSAFLWKAWIQRIEYGLNDIIRKKCSYIDTLLIYTLWYKISNDFDGQSDFSKLKKPLRYKSAKPLFGKLIV